MRIQKKRTDKLAIMRDAIARLEAQKHALVTHVRELECIIADQQVQIDRFIAREAELLVKGTWTTSAGKGEYDPVAGTVTYKLAPATAKKRGLG